MTTTAFCDADTQTELSRDAHAAWLRLDLARLSWSPVTRGQGAAA